MDDIASVIGTKTYDVLSVVPIIGNGDYNRVNNAINYLSPSVGNTTFQLQYGFGAQRDRSDASPDFGRLVSANVLHASGPLTLGAGFIKVADADGTAAGKQGKDAVLLVGAYDFGSVKLSAYVDQEDKAAEKLKVMGGAAAFKLGETTVSVGAAQARNVNGSAGAMADDARIYTLQASHNLSKRTALYSHLTAVSNEGSAALGFNSPVAGSNSSGIQFGIRHRF
jgi:predicted porin